MDEARRVRIPDLILRKQRGEKIAMLTAYDASFARLLDAAGVDILLVGDSLGMVVLGYADTLPVTLDDMIHHTAAVARGASRALVVADMPFMSFRTGLDEAVRNAGRLLQEGGAAGVKIEGGLAVCDVIGRLVALGIPVMGHLGLLPQSVHQIGGFRPQGRKKGDAQRLVAEAKAVEAAGAFAIVLESIPAEVARKVTSAVRVPTIGIGAGPDCDGQVLVSYDALGLTGVEVPPFVRRYAELDVAIRDAAARYIEDVRKGRFPKRS